MLQVLKESSCDYNIFIKDITEIVKEMMGEEYTARIYKVTKNNALELDSLVLLKEGKDFAPNIYLRPYYDAYLEGATMKELADRLCDIYRNYATPIVREGFQYNFEEMKPDIIYRLVNYDKNRKLLETIPHIKFLDLAVTFHCLVHNDKEGIGTIRITNEHIQSWKTSAQELHGLAAQNTQKRFLPVIRNMNDVIKSMITEEINNEEEFPDQLLEDLFEQHDNSDKLKMYILSNANGINGATCLLYHNVINKFAEQLSSDLFILPSSIHEVILIPYDKSLSKNALIEMVKDVNRTQVAMDEVLSDSVYFYSRKNNIIML